MNHQYRWHIRLAPLRLVSIVCASGKDDACKLRRHPWDKHVESREDTTIRVTNHRLVVWVDAPSGVVDIEI
jgi:hypothetical protein